MSTAPKIDTARELSLHLGVSHTAVNKWLKDERWTFGAGPWPVSLLPKIRAWRTANLAENPAKDEPTDPALELSQLGPERRAKITRVLIQSQRDKFNLDKDKGLFHSVAECESRQLRKIQAVKAELLTTSQRMLQDTPPAIREWVKAEMERICNVFAAKD